MASLVPPNFKRKVEENDDPEEEKLNRHPKKSRIDSQSNDAEVIGEQLTDIKVDELQIELKDVTKNGNEKAVCLERRKNLAQIGTKY